VRLVVIRAPRKVALVRRLLWLLTILVVVGVIAWLAPRNDRDDAADAANSDSNDPPGYVALDAEVTETGLDGRPVYRLLAERVERTASGGQVLLSKPRLSYEPTAGSHWTLQADSGVLMPDSQQVTLTGAIVATGSNAGDPPLTLRTEQLALDMLQQRADTNGRVTMEQQPMQLNALGLHLNLRELTWTLDSDGHFKLRR
jgi:LPS export ABC transporter protein LptC